MRRHSRLQIVTLAVAVALLAASRTAAQDEKPVASVTSFMLALVPKALDGDADAAQKLAALGPIARRAAEDTTKRLLEKWRFKPLKSGRQTIEIDVSGQARQYTLIVPKRYSAKRSWPLILSLHGAGGNGSGEIDFLWSRHLSEWPGLIAAPSGVPPGAQWFPEQVPFVLGVIEDVCRRASIDTNRVYVNGFSNGGNGAWFYAQNHPGRFAAACTRGGGNPTPALLLNLLHVPIYIVHGDQDRVIAVDHDRRDAKRLSELGYTVEYTEVAGGGHKPFTDEENPKIIAFLRKHVRNPWPKKLLFRAARPERFRNLWLEVPAGAAAQAEVRAEVKDGNVIEVTGARRVVLWLGDALMDLDQELVVNLDGKEAFRGKAERRFSTLVADLKERFDRTAPAWARLEVGQ
ncbi:MAG: dienelactone hydrolase family protein [Planctomycetes bacterium]|nr:dienelactone hydrolase family protein [Planctomycetota bacterium]